VSKIYNEDLKLNEVPETKLNASLKWASNFILHVHRNTYCHRVLLPAMQN